MPKIRLDMDINEFRKWLEGQDPDAVSGYSGRSESCPISNWLAETLPGPQIEVGVVYAESRSYLDSHAYGLTMELPEWATHFVREVDSRWASAIPVSGALHALDIISNKTE